MSTENTSFRFTAEEETPVHGHTELTEEQVEAVNEQLRDIADVPAIEIISSAAIHMMSAAAVKCGLAADEKRRRPQGPRRSTQAHHRAGRPRHRRSTRNRLPARSAPAPTAAHPAARIPRSIPLPGRARQGPRRKAHRPGVLTVPGLFTAKAPSPLT